MFVHEGHKVYTVKDLIDLLKTFPEDHQIALNYESAVAYSIMRVSERPQEMLKDGITKGVVDFDLTPSYIMGQFYRAPDNPEL